MTERGITEVGKYQIIEQIGEGAMGVVYRARDPVLNRTVAIKVMSDALARDDDLRSRFLREAQAAGSLQHPNVITIYDFGEVDGHLYIAMEFVAGHDLEDMLRKSAPMTIVQKIDILVDVLGGLGYAHKRGVVHRDVKPANIRIDEEGRARLMDFGIAHLQSSTITRTGLMVGTPAYMAPEQVSGGVVSAQTDIFSTGAVMYELFAGRKPFEGESLQSVFYKIVSQQPPDLATVAPRLPTSLNTIVMRALAKDPAVRYGTASEMASDLTDARAHLDRVSSQPRALSLNASIASGLLETRATRPIPVQRSRSQIAIVSVAALVIVAAGAGIFLKTRTPNAPPTPAAAPSTSVAQPPSAPVSPPSSAPTVQNAGAPAPAPSATAKAPPSSKKDASTLTADGLELFRSLQGTATDMRTRASEAGATIADLRAGDDHNAAANAAAQRGNLTDAATHLKLASSAWAVAERDARAAAATAAAAAANAKRVEAPKTEPIPPAPVITSPQVQAAAPAPKPATLPAVNPATEIDAVIRNYERAIGTRDIAELKRAYPAMTAAQSKNWEDFFGTLRSMNASLTVNALDVKGDAADARISGSYDFVSTSGKATRQPANFQASFRRENGVWRLVAVR
jgi:serine/threonine-protein kinase